MHSNISMHLFINMESKSIIDKIVLCLLLFREYIFGVCTSQYSGDSIYSVSHSSAGGLGNEIILYASAKVTLLQDLSSGR